MITLNALTSEQILAFVNNNPEIKAQVEAKALEQEKILEQQRQAKEEQHNKAEFKRLLNISINQSNNVNEFLNSYDHLMTNNLLKQGDNLTLVDLAMIILKLKQPMESKPVVTERKDINVIPSLQYEKQNKIVEQPIIDVTTKIKNASKYLDIFDLKVFALIIKSDKPLTSTDIKNQLTFNKYELSISNKCKEFLNRSVSIYSVDNSRNNGTIHNTLNRLNYSKQLIKATLTDHKYTANCFQYSAI